MTKSILYVKNIEIQNYLMGNVRDFYILFPMNFNNEQFYLPTLNNTLGHPGKQETHMVTTNRNPHSLNGPTCLTF